MTGTIGEKLAVDYLIRGGYKILKTNVEYPWGEIDIITRDRDKTLVFVEVKTLNKYGKRNKEGFGLRPEDNLTRSKMDKLRRSCSFFANAHKRLADNGWRIDLISLTICDDYYDVRHLKNVE